MKGLKGKHDAGAGDPDGFDKMLYLNLGSPIRLTRVLAPAMVKKGDSNIINISSVAGKPWQAFASCLTSRWSAVDGLQVQDACQ